MMMVEREKVGGRRYERASGVNSQGKLSARGTKLESDTRRSNFAIGWKFRQSLSCYTANV